jgi:AcrR family transcriptional regulator
MATRKRAPRRRTYTQRRRAEQQSETRRRIVQAVYDLHGEIGPARTTISAIAERAGVERLTVYRHFADEGEIFAACNAHFLAETPPPHPATWAAVTEPAARLRAVLLTFYGYYRRTEDRLGLALRDAEDLPALAAVLEPWGRFVESVRDDLQEAWAASDDARPKLAAAIGHALRFETWRSLAQVEGLADAAAADLMVALARGAAADA